MIKHAIRSTIRSLYRGLLPRRFKNTLRQWLVLDWKDQPVEVIADFAVGPVLVLAPHMDDEIVGCGGALRKHVLAGVPVTSVIVTDGRRGNPDIYRDASLGKEAIAQAESQMVDRRKQESTAAAEIMGVENLVFLDMPDGNLQPTQSVIDRLIEILNRVKPALIYLPSMLDTHLDHWATSRIFHRCLKAISKDMHPSLRLREYEVWSPLLANRLVDIEDVVDVKRQALLQFKTQLERFDLVHVSLGLNAFRSMYPFKGRGHAEAFYESTPEQYRALVRRFTEAR